MKRIFTIIVIFTIAIFSKINAQCPVGQNEIMITIVPDGYPNEISWSLRDASSNALIDTGGAVGDTLCLPSGQCVRFFLRDNFGDGILNPGYYQVKVNGNIVAQGGQNYDYSITHYFNCPPGSSCADPFVANGQGSYTAPHTDSWYAFIADTTGNYRFSTCGVSTCNTRIYGYSSCAGIMFDDEVLGITFFNDDYCGLQSQVDYGMQEGDTVFVRIGDAGTDCGSNPINWTATFTGPIVGCMDPAACNYNPLATVADTNCVYSGPLCQGPDLAPDGPYLAQTLSINNNHIAQTCEVQEGCIMGYGTRKLLYFGVRIWNYGTQPYWPGTPQNNPNGYEFAPCHGHYHYKGFANSYLYDANLNQVDFARKTSYAIVNMGCTNPTSDPPLAAGCQDTYGAGYACQWVDVTDMDPGLYHLVLKINPDGLPDYIGRDEINMANNGTQVCINLTEDALGNKAFTIEPNCPVFTDCMGIPFGNTPTDCEGNCNGVKIRGDLNLDTLRNFTDVNLYVQQLAWETLSTSNCNDLTGDSLFTVFDAARLNGCLKDQDSTHIHLGGYSGNHGHCNFPFGVSNQFDSITIGLSNLTDSTVDITIKNPNCFMLASEFYIHGIDVDSVKSISGIFNPMIEYNMNGHVVVLAKDEYSLNKLYTPTPVFRAYFKNRTDTILCIDQIVDVVNSNYEKVTGLIGSCVEYEAPIIDGISYVMPLSNLNVVPNPSKGNFQISMTGALMFGARYQVINSVGAVVMDGVIETNNNRFDIDMKGFDNGVYLLNIEGKNVKASKRLVVVK